MISRKEFKQICRTILKDEYSRFRGVKILSCGIDSNCYGYSAYYMVTYGYGLCDQLHLAYDSWEDRIIVHTQHMDAIDRASKTIYSLGEEFKDGEE